MTLGDFLEKFGKTLFEAPLSGAPHLEAPAELAEIRLAILDRVREKSYRSGGKKVFPYDLIRVELRGVDESRRDLFAGNFFRRYLEQEVHGALRAAGCRYPENLRVDVEPRVGLPQRGEEWLLVEAASQESAHAGRTGRLSIQEGSANCAELRLDKSRVNIGRARDVYRSEGIYRRNDLIFEEDTEINRSVSREHAHIQFDKVSGEYRLFNDRWTARGEREGQECGTWIVRDGMSQEVHRSARGFRLEPGDEIHFGRVIAIFELE
ncbi:MAG TPA: FHA domain-containing protein [Candidatus Sulfopaludibacter sp.]|jgi:hypothetical protein|nr:FHA domain-containing protein [Candidatus Sulfopaludibacter sp.]